MRVIRIAAIAIVGIFVGAVILVKSLTIYVPVGHVGVRVQEYGLFGTKGVVAEDFGPGWHRDLGFIDSWVVFDSTVQTLEMTRDPSRGTKMGRDDVQVQSSDGFTVSVDITIKYRIKEGKAHEVLKNTGAGDKYKVIVRTEAQQACIAFFGEMKTEDFYNPKHRRDRTAQVRERLSKSLADNHVEVVDVLMRDVNFSQGYEDQILEKKLEDQKVELKKSQEAEQRKKGIADNIVAETKKIVEVIKEEKKAELVTMKATMDLQIAKIRAEAEKYALEKTSEADRIKAEKTAEGQLRIKRAEAEGEKLRNRAMMGVGGSTIVAREAARNLNLEDITISTVAIDLLDIDGMATKLGVPER